MKFHPVALALVPKVIHSFSQVPKWHLPVSLLHKGPIEGNIELGKPQDGTPQCHIMDHCPWQGSPVPVPPASPAQESLITVLVSDQIFTEFLTDLFSQFVVSMCARMCSGARNPAGCTGKEPQQLN